MSPDAAPLRVLLVDDEKNIRTTLGLCLESLGCQVSAVATPEAARVLGLDASTMWRKRMRCGA